MAISQNLKTCIQAFVERDYARVASHSGEVMRQDPSLLMVQLHLISLQRLGQQDELDHVALEILRATIGFPRDHNLIRLTLGHMELDEVLGMFDEPEHAPQAYYYAGARAVSCGQPDIAEEYLQESMSDAPICLESVLAEGELVSLLEEQAKTHYALGKYDDAIRVSSKALQICLARGEDNPRSVGFMHNLAMYHLKAGHYHEAEYWATRAAGAGGLEADTEIDADNYEQLTGLADVYRDTDRYQEAIEIYERVVRFLKTHPDDFRLAIVLNNLGLAYGAVGNSIDAVKSFMKAIQIREGDPNSTQVLAESYNNLAEQLRAGGLLPESEKYYRKAIEIKSRTVGTQHPSYAISAHGLGISLTQIGRYKKAEKWIRVAMKVMQGQENVSAAAFLLNSLAFVFSALGDFREARSLQEQALTLRRFAFGEDHSHYSTGLINLASACVSDGDMQQAWKLYEQAIQVDARIFPKILTIGSERQRMEYTASVRGNMNAIMSLACISDPTDMHALTTAADLALRRKGVEAELQGLLRSRVFAGNNPQLESLFRDLNAVHEQISGAALESHRSQDNQRQKIEELENEKQRLEAELVRNLSETELHDQIQPAGSQAIASAIPDDVALVEFVRFNVFDFKAVAERVSYEEWIPPRKWLPARYLAFVFISSQPEKVSMFDLGEAGRIDELISTFRNRIIDSLGDPSGYDQDGPSQLESELRSSVFDKLIPAFENRTKLLLAPDGDLSILPFEVLRTDKGQHLIETYHISYVTSGREVLRFGSRTDGSSYDALVIADPEYDLADPPGQGQSDHCGDRSRCSRDFDRLEPFSRLPDTRLEGEKIADMLGVSPLLDEKAVESRIKTCKSPFILHIATHGFFLPDQYDDPNRDGHSRAEIAMLPDDGSIRTSILGRENPMLRSGLVFAGVNTWRDGRETPPEAEDGVLTAEDVSGIDLTDTQLVVLSACQTALGSVHVGEGVFGLRRAFVLAGAKTLVMSLWHVADKQTLDLMVLFYKRMLAGEPRAEALRQARLTIKKSNPHPFYWGAFICQGDPGPLGITTKSIEKEALEQ